MMRKLPDGSLSVLVGRHGADEWLLPRVERFGAQYPAYDLRIDTRGRLVDLAAERIDVGIRYGGGRWPGLKATFLTRDAFFRCAALHCSRVRTRFAALLTCNIIR